MATTAGLDFLTTSTTLPSELPRDMYVRVLDGVKSAVVISAVRAAVTMIENINFLLMLDLGV
jgi:hypothetical protein